MLQTDVIIVAFSVSVAFKGLPFKRYQSQCELKKSPRTEYVLYEIEVSPGILKLDFWKIYVIVDK